VADGPEVMTSTHLSFLNELYPPLRRADTSHRAIYG